MPDTLILVCDCGKRLRAPGAIPGRVGRCPACGGLLRVAESDSTGGPLPPPGTPRPVLGPASIPRPAASTPPASAVPPPPTPRRKKRRRRDDEAPTAIWDGLIAAPRQLETNILQSLGYPLWGATGVAALVILPPLLWFLSIPAFGGLIAALGGNGSPPALMGLFLFLPGALGLFCVLGYTLVFLGRVLASSALGDVHHPHWPDWEISALWHGFSRWLWAGLVGVVVGGIPATAYWIQCGDLDLFDRIILAELVALGAAYALMALLASILHDDTLGANPITVLTAIYRLGWSYAQPCLVAGAAIVIVAPLMAAVGQFDGYPALSAALLYVAWLVALYASMVVLRVLGLYYHAHARQLGWFRGRTGWGV